MYLTFSPNFVLPQWEHLILNPSLLLVSRVFGWLTPSNVLLLFVITESEHKAKDQRFHHHIITNKNILNHAPAIFFYNFSDRLRYIWTGGRKCNFRGCDRPDLQPTIVNGWFWAARRSRVPAKDKCDYCEWSPTGGNFSIYK